MCRILIYGNSGSGKSTLAKKISIKNKLPYLDLDCVAWKSPAIRKTHEDTLKELSQYMALNSHWVIEGCYGTLIAELTKTCTDLYFLNPGIDVCLKNNLTRPWEPHKYESIEAQNKNLELLQNWVREYESRTDEFSLQYHRAIFDKFNGNKQEIKSLSSEAVPWL